METPYEKKFGKVEPVEIKNHRRGWFRSAYYWMGWEYESQNDCPLAYTYTNNQVYKLLENFDNINIFQTHIFPYKIDDYKNNIYVKEDWFEAMSDNMFKILEEKLGWHLCITCNK